jgi:cellobiose phosphorylase
MALIKKGNADEAYKVFSGINPLTQNMKLKNRSWIPEYYVSSDNPNIAERRISRFNRFIAQDEICFSELLFGVKGLIDGLLIDPRLPAVKEFKESLLK